MIDPNSCKKRFSLDSNIFINNANTCFNSFSPTTLLTATTAPPDTPCIQQQRAAKQLVVWDAAKNPTHKIVKQLKKLSCDTKNPTDNKKVKKILCGPKKPAIKKFSHECGSKKRVSFFGLHKKDDVHTPMCFVCDSTTSTIPDTGCTDLLFKCSTAHKLENRRPFHDLCVTVANHEVIRSSEMGDLRVPTPTGDLLLPAYIFPDNVLSNNLVGLSAFCNAGCTVTLTSTAIDISLGGTSIWHDVKAPHDRLWKLDLDTLPNQPTEVDKIGATEAAYKTVEPVWGTAHQSIRLDTDAEYVRFAHAVFGSHPISTFVNATAKGWLGNFPKLTARMIRQNPPVERATAMGYLDQTRQGLQSTKPKRDDRHNLVNDAEDIDTDEDYAETTAEPRVCFQVLSTETWLNSTDATGRLPFTTLSGWNYVLVSTMRGYVHLQLIRDRTKAEYTRAYRDMYAFYRSHGKCPTTQRLDNETSDELEGFLREAQVQIQYVPPGIHRQNPAESVLRHAKNCIFAMCSTADANFPSGLLFQEAVPQTEIVMNQLRPWHSDPTINAWTGMHNAPYDHLAHPISIYGMRVVVHEKADQRGSWALHGKDGFYLGPALQHYRCWRTYISETRATRITDTIAWLPDPYRMPGHSPLEAITAAVQDLSAVVDTLVNSSEAELLRQSDAAPSVGQQLTGTVQQLRDLFDCAPSPESTPVTKAPTVVPNQVPHASTAAYPYGSVERVTERGTEHIDAPVSEAPPLPPSKPLRAPRPLEYVWTQAHAKDFSKQSARKHFFKVGKLFTDDMGTHCIVSVDRNTAKASGPGSKTLFYKYYNVTAFMEPPANHNDYDHIPCAELNRDPSVQWTSSVRVAKAMSAQVLNLNQDGSPLTFSSAEQGKDGPEWILASDTEFRKLVTGTETIRPIHKSDIPHERRRDIAYYNRQVKEKIKNAVHVRRVRGTIGGDRTNFTGEVTARTASLEVVRTLLNSVLADDAAFMTCDVVDYYLGTPMERSEYMRMTRKQISDTIMQEYDLDKYCVDGVVHFEVVKGMYGLPQAGLLAQQRMVKHLATAGYSQSTIIPCLFRHATNGVSFVLVVDDFGVKISDTAGRDHLLATLREQYKITVDEEGSQYLGMTIVHDRQAQTITISMPGYIEKMLTRFSAWLGDKTAPSPGIYHPPTYGAKTQYATIDDTEPLSADDIKTLQAVVGSFLYYARATDPTMLTHTNELGSEQAHATEAVKQKAIRLLQYAAAHPDHQIVYRKSKMDLILQGDASYLSRSKARSVAGGIAYFGDADNPTVENGMVHAISTIIDVVVASAGEAEYGAGFLIAQHGVYLRNIATELGHRQKATPILCDNAFAIGLGNDTIKQKRSKSIDMRFHWLRDRIRQGQFTIQYLAGKLNLADFFTKTLPTKEHRAIMPRLVQSPAKSANAFLTEKNWHCVRHRVRQRSHSLLR